MRSQHVPIKSSKTSRASARDVMPLSFDTVLRLFIAAAFMFTLATLLLAARLDPDEDVGIVRLIDAARSQHRKFAVLVRVKLRQTFTGAQKKQTAATAIRQHRIDDDLHETTQTTGTSVAALKQNFKRRRGGVSGSSTSILPPHVLLRLTPLPPVDKSIFPPVDEDSIADATVTTPHADVPRYMNELAPVKVKPLPPPKQKPPKPQKENGGMQATNAERPRNAAKQESEQSIHAAFVGAVDDPSAWTPTQSAAADADDAQAATRKETTAAAATPTTTRANKGSNFHLDIAEVRRLLDSTSIDVTMNQILLEMRGSITCGGRPLMEFRTMEDVMAAAADDNAESPVEAGLEVLNAVLPESDEVGALQLGSCAVVGNSGVLLNSSLGEEIDAHDSVIRFNAAPTKKFEQDVGRKTTIRIQNVDHLGYHEHQDGHKVFSFRNAKDLKKFVKHKRKYVRSGDKMQYAFNPEFWCHVWDFVAHRKLKPTTGLAGVVLALHGCSRGKVDLYGFAYGSDEFHYFNKLAEKVTKVEVHRYHPLREESALYRELQGLNLTNVVEHASEFA